MSEKKKEETKAAEVATPAAGAETVAQEPATKETAAQEPPAAEPVSFRQRWIDAIKAKNPDLNAEDEDKLYEAAMRGYDEEHEWRKKNEESNRKLADTLLNSDPNVATFLTAILSGESFPYALGLVKDFIPKEGEESYEDYTRGVEDNKAKVKEQMDKAEEYAKNVQESAAALKEFAAQLNMSDEEAVDFVNQIRETLADKLFSGKVDVEFLTRMHKLLNYDNDIKIAREAGRIEGRNERIDSKRKKAGATDGLPNTNTSGTKAKEPAPSNPTLDALDRMVERYNRTHV